jgi:hypothetical protein
MAAKKLDKAGDKARQVRESRYLQKLLEDPELRENIRSAFSSGRAAVSRATNGKGPSKALFEDKKFQKELRNAGKSLRNVGDALKPPRKKRRGGLGRLVLVALVGGVAAVALSGNLRSKLLDKLFGAEEEFDYSAPITPTPAAEPAAPEPVNDGTDASVAAGAS